MKPFARTQRRARRSHGQAVIEYAMLLSLMSMIVLGLVQKIGAQVNCLYTQTSNGLAQTTGGCTSVSFGFGADGELGNGSGHGSNNQSSATQMYQGSIREETASDLNGYLMTSTGNIYGWGPGWAGQIGNGGWSEEDSPTQVTYSDGTPLTGFVQIASGSDHVLALRADGTVWAWGRNDSGNLGDGTTAGRDYPEQVCSVNFPYPTPTYKDSAGVTGPWVPTDALGDDNNLTDAPPACAASSSYLTGVVQVAVDDRGSNFALLKDGSVVAWGSAWTNLLGIGYASAPDPCPSSSWGSPPDGPFQCAPVPTPVCGGTTGFITAPCSSDLTGVSKIFNGENTTFAQMSDGSVVAWGDNAYGEIGNGTECFGNPSVTNTPCGGPSAGLSYTSPVIVPALDGVTQISGGSWHELALKSDGTVLAWGDNATGQMGINSSCGSEGCSGSTTPEQIPSAQLSGVVQVAGGGYSSAAVKSDGTLWMWGDNSQGEMGTAPCQATQGWGPSNEGLPSNTCVGSLKPVQVPGATNISAVYLMACTTIAISKNTS